MKASSLLTLVPTCALFIGLAGCGTDEVKAVIGPAGGTVAVTDKGSPLYGIKVEIPPGALASEANIAIRAADAKGLPALQAGLAAFEPIFELASDVRFDRAVRMIFPVQSEAVRNDQVLSGFFADPTTGTWQVAVARSLEGDAFSVKTSSVGTWRWGVMLLDRVRYETLKPAMVAVVGATHVEAIEDAATAQFDTLVGDLKTSQDAWDDCDSIAATVAAIRSFRDLEEQDMRADMATVCGGCDVPGEVFISDLYDYLKAKARLWLTNLLVEAASPNFLIELVLKLEAAYHFDQVLQRLSCDFECLADESPPGFWGHVGGYIVCDVALVFIAIGVSYTDCPSMTPLSPGAG